MHTLTTAEFLGTPVSILDHAGRRWLTARDVGRCLGYAEEHARHAILKLFARHKDEFGPDDTGVVNLTTPTGGTQNTRIFSHSGCILLAMFANTARAKDFRAWAKRVLAGDTLPAHAEAANAWGRRVKVNRTIERQAMELYVAGLETASIARHLGVSKSAIKKMLSGQYRFSPASGPDETTPALIAAVAAERARREQDRIVDEYVASAVNQRLQQALESVGRQMLVALQSVTVEG
jgi:predicted transcriptional regulator